MSMPPEPLTPEERALAQSLSRLGPHGGPSAELDARILGAARAAVRPTGTHGGHVPPTRRRWPLGMGVAASVLLAAGIAWQLRPTHEVPVASEMPATAEYPGRAPAAQDVAAADAAAVPAADEAAAPAMVAEEPLPPPPAKVLTPPAGRSASGPARQNAEAAARQEPVPKRSAIALLPTPPSPPAAPQAFPAEAADAYARTSTAGSDEAIAEGVAREQEREQRIALTQQEQRARDNEERREAAVKADDNRTLDTIAVTGSRVKRRENQTKVREVGAVQAPVAAAPPPPPPAPAASAGSVQPSAARNALRRTDLQVPVDADTRLPPDEWLDRIRLRRDLGDDANALRSLQLFVQEHPFQRVPDDLRPLLGNP